MSFIRKAEAPPMVFKDGTVQLQQPTLFLRGQPQVNKEGSVHLIFDLRGSNDRTRDNLVISRFLEIDIRAEKTPNATLRVEQPDSDGNPRVRINAVVGSVPAAWGKGKLPKHWPSNIFAQGYFLGGLLDELQEWEWDEPHISLV
jgi:hypothetical protein